jgi:starvation-inducible outer membrane lipoprotein
MKTQLAIISALLVLTGCAGSYPERIVTKGPLICNSDEICPELALRWNDEKRNGFKITADINDKTQHDIKQLNFIVDGQPYIYSTIEATQYQTNEGIINSANFINVPVSFLNSFRGAKEIDLKIVTSNGELTRPILKADGQKSSAYLTFLKGYTGQIVE